MTLAAFQSRAPEPGRLARRLSAAAMRIARRHPLETSLFAGLGTMLASAYLVFALLPPLERAAVPAPAVAAWIDVPKPLPMFSFSAPEFGKAAAAYAMRRHSTGGGREDALTFGNFGEPGAYLRIVVHQIGAEGAGSSTLFVEGARRAAEAGLALDSLGAPTALQTRFGQAELAGAKLAAPGQAAAREGCSLFRFSADDPAIRVSGLVCGPEGVAYTRRQAACLIGGLDLAAASEDDALQKFFARSELARDAACANPRARASAQPAKSPARQKPVRAAMQR